MEHREFMTEAVALAADSVEQDWGGPCGAAITRDGEIIIRGQNGVLQVDPAAHGTVGTIRKTVWGPRWI
ncbi:hypothetical protein ACWCXH_27385 [Kitasatospora sp. NPDC001660]